MIIKSLDIENFLCYNETQNNFKFSEGPTIIIGQNKAGKSKLFDAFNWVLYDKAYNTDKDEWEHTKKWNENLINTLAKNNCKINDTVSCAVSLKFITENDVEYYLTREYSIKKLSSNKWDCPQSSEVSLTITDRNNNDTYFEGKEATDKISILFPENLSKYFFFQGENISDIMKLNSRSDFNKALKDLSRIEIFEKVKHYSNKLHKTISSEFQSKQDKNKSIQERKVEISERINEIKNIISRLKEQKENFTKERDIAKDVFEKKNDELMKYEECGKIINDIELLKKDLKISQEKLINVFEVQKKDVFDIWMYVGTDKLINGFLNYYKKNKKEKKIPEPISQDMVNEMLKTNHCKICGRPFLNDSDEHRNILNFKNDKALDEQIEFIMGLNIFSEQAIKRIVEIPNEITRFYNKLENIEESIKSIKQKIGLKEQELIKVIPKGTDKSKLESKLIQDLKEARNKANNDYYELEGKIKQIIGKTESKQEELKKLELDFNDIIESSSNRLEKEKMKIVEKLNSLAIEMHDKFLQSLFKNIEDEANIYFQKMTMNNPALSGKVKIDYDSQEIFTVDENNVRLLNINQANKVSLQISFVAAILSVSNKFWKTYFPFIADAPISALGGNNKLNAINTIIDTFSQSILILKDDAHLGNNESVKSDPVRKLIRDNENIKNSYELLMKGDTIDSQKTEIINIKQT